MGNGVGKMVGVVAGAACQLIPGVGTVLGTVILAGTIGAGSTVDAIIDNNKQNDEADRIAEENRKNAAIELERQRLEAQKKLEDELKKAHEERAVSELELERQREIANQENQRQQAIVRYNQTQLGLVERSFLACENGDFSEVPGCLESMDDQHFEVFRQSALSRCSSADAIEDCRALLEHEQMRREVLNQWHMDIEGTVEISNNSDNSNRQRSRIN